MIAIEYFVKYMLNIHCMMGVQSKFILSIAMPRMENVIFDFLRFADYKLIAFETLPLCHKFPLQTDGSKISLDCFSYSIY